jgi:methionyl-tRNA formyltransferase
MKVGFAGTPAFAVTVMDALLDAGIAISLVLTQPDRPSGRGQNVQHSPLKHLALERGLMLYQPSKLSLEPERAPVIAQRIDVLVVAAYGLILPRSILDWPRYGCINVHASLLPRWRGAAPIQRALLAGDAETGATIMQMDPGLDTGPIIVAARIPIGPRDTAASLEHALAIEGAKLLIDVLDRLARGASIERMAQPTVGVTYAAKIDKAEAHIRWDAEATFIDRMVRAFDPAPGAVTAFQGESAKLWRASVASSTARASPPGTVLAIDAAGIVVACGIGTLRVEEIHPAGGRRMSAASYAIGRRLAPGSRFDIHPKPLAKDER